MAPLTAGVATAGGSLRQGQAYAVNGMRPESNMYLVDGGQNVNRMDGGYALKLPVEAIAEFRILTQSAPPEYGGTGGATTSVITRSGSNQFHGNAYEFIRNDVFDARNYFSEKVEPLKQNQFGGTIGGPIARNRLLFFGYYEGFRNKQGYTTTATVPTDLQRDRRLLGSRHAAHQLRRGRRAVPRQQDPAGRPSTRCRSTSWTMYPHANVGTSLYRETVLIDEPAGSAGRPRRLQRLAEQPVLRALLLFRRAQPQPGVRPRHRRAGLPDPRRPGHAPGQPSRARRSCRRR